MRTRLLSCLLGASLLLSASAGAVSDKVASAWIDAFTPSTLTPAQQRAELDWFASAATPLQGVTIRVATGRSATHRYEAQTLARAFTQVTGIEVTHELLDERDIVDQLQAQLRSGERLYDAYASPADLIGTHFRRQEVRNLTDWMAGEGAGFTLPTLDLADFIGSTFTTAPDDKLYQLPDQQAANLYWFRYDWFTNPALKARFEARFGYPLGVPLNWSAYEDIADFFTNDVREIDGQRVYGHMAYGKAAATSARRRGQPWFSAAGTGDTGLPSGNPVDDWGIRAEGCQPSASSVQRGGATDGPAALYTLTRYIKWLQNYAPPGAATMSNASAGDRLARGDIAQQMFWDTGAAAALLAPSQPLVDAAGSPKWRMAPSPRGPYWRNGQKRGYQSISAWTLPQSTPVKQAQAAWLYAQFVTSKTVSLKKSHEGLSFIRTSDIHHPSFTQRADRLAGLVEFYRSADQGQWTPAGTNIPDYTHLAMLWEQHINAAIAGDKTPRESMTALARAQDKRLRRLQRSKVLGDCGPQLNDRKSRNYWLSRSGAPREKLAQEKPPGKTIDYDTLVRSWRQSP